MLYLVSQQKIENPVKQLAVDIVTDRKNYLKGTFRPTSRREKQLNNGLTIQKDTLSKHIHLV